MKTTDSTPVIDLRRVRYFVALCDTLNYAKTARLLRISQPALTKAIMRLEQELGGKLIRREGRLSQLTPLGKLMLQEFAMLEQVATRTSCRAARLVRSTRSMLSIGVTATPGPKHISAFLEHYCVRHPNVQLRLRHVALDAMSDTLLNDHLDCGFTLPMSTDAQRLRYIPLYRDSLMVIHPCRHRFVDLTSVGLHDLLTESVIDGTQGRFQEWLSSVDAPLCHAPGPRLQCDRIDWVQALVLNGQGIAVAPGDTILVEELIARPLETLGYFSDVSLAVPTGRMDNPALQCFIDSATEFGWSRTIAES